LTTAERKRILLNNLYGVDIDMQAVEVTKLSLLLKVLEGESEESLSQLMLFHERALPDLGGNIRCGNSLIGPDFYQGRQLDLFDSEDTLRINAFDWQAEFAETMARGGFDAVIGNPPYDVMEKERGQASWPHAALAEYARQQAEWAAALGGKLNLFRFFLVRGVMLTRTGGQFGMIVPLAVLGDITCSKTRGHIARTLCELEADCFPQKDNANRRVFRDAKLSTVVLCGAKSPVPRGDSDAALTTRVYPWNSFKDACKANSVTLAQVAVLDPENLPVPLAATEHWQLCYRIHTSRCVSLLGRVPDFAVTRGEINQTVYREFISENTSLAVLLKGVELGPYRLNAVLKQGRREWFDATKSPKLVPNSTERRIATQRITGVDEVRRLTATLVDPVTYFADSTNSITGRGPHDLCYLLGLLNSRLFQWRFKITSTNNNVGTNEIESLPFRRIDFADAGERSRHDRMVALVGQMLELNRQLAAVRTPHERTALERQIEATDREIDRLVYGLYGLSADEIRLVEESA
jgi:hypothetical protein